MKESNITGMLTEKKKLLIQLQDMDKAIKSLLLEDNIDALNEKLEYRRKKIIELEELGKEYSKDDLLQCNNQDLIKEIELILSDIQKTDKENRDLAKDTLDRYRGQIRSLNESKKRMGSYTQAEIYSDGYFVDAKK